MADSNLLSFLSCIPSESITVTFSCLIGDFCDFFFLFACLFCWELGEEKICSPISILLSFLIVPPRVVFLNADLIMQTLGLEPSSALLPCFWRSLNYFTWSIMPWSLPWPDSCLCIISCEISLQYLHSRYTDPSEPYSGSRINLPLLPLCLCSAPFCLERFFHSFSAINCSF